jgi:integrase
VPRRGQPLGPAQQRRPKWVGGFRTAAKAARRKALGILDADDDPFPEALATSVYLEQWLDSSRERVRPGTWRRYVQLLRTHVIPEIGTIELRKMKPAHVRRCLEAMTAKGLAPATRTQARAALGRAFREAVDGGLAASNPVSAVPRPRNDRRRDGELTVAQLHQLFDAVTGTA